MRSLLPLLAGLLPVAEALDFPQLIFPRQTPPKNTTQSTKPSWVEKLQPQAAFSKRFGGASFGFAITASNKTGDVSIRMKAPREYSWIAFGTGDSMDGSLMFVMYRGVDGTNTKISPRLGHGYTEPLYEPRINMSERTPGSNDTQDGLTSTSYFGTAVCHNCLNFGKTPIDTRRADMPFIFALGPRQREPFSNRMDAPLRQHIYWGKFTMNLTQAAGDDVPSLKLSGNDAVITVDPQKSYDYLDATHMFFMVITFVIIIPLGIMILRIFEKVKLHAIIQAIALICVIIGFGTGLVLSKKYNRSQKVNSAHQVIGIIVFVFILVQFTLGALSHRTFQKTGQPMKWAMTPHRLIIGPVVFALGIVNASIGFRFANANSLNWVFLPIMLFVIISMALSGCFKRFYQRRKGINPHANNNVGANGPYGAQTTGVAPHYAPPGQQGAYQHTGAYAASRSDIALHNLGDPPAYQASATKPREFA